MYYLIIMLHYKNVFTIQKFLNPHNAYNFQINEKMHSIFMCYCSSSSYCSLGYTDSDQDTADGKIVYGKNNPEHMEL